MRLRMARTDKRSFSRRLVDEEAREFVEKELEETRDVYRTASGEFQLKALCRDVFAAGSTTDLRWLKRRRVDPEGFYETARRADWDGVQRDARAAGVEGRRDPARILAGRGVTGERPVVAVACVG